MKLIFKFKNPIFFLIIFTFFNQISNKMFLESEMKEICKYSEEINSFFSEINEKTNDQYLDYYQKTTFETKDSYILKTFLLNEKSAKAYKKLRLGKYIFYKTFFILEFIISIIIFLSFNIHFISREYKNKNKENNKQKDDEITLFKFCKISPFCWIKFLIYNKEKRNNYYIKHKIKKIHNINKVYKILIFLITFILLIISGIFTIRNQISYKKVEKETKNMTCILMKFLYEIKKGSMRENSFIGLDKINSFILNFNLKYHILEENIQKFNYEFIEKENKLIIDWNNFIKELDKILTNEDFVIFSYPSDLNYTRNDIDKLTKYIYQLKYIYDFYPSINENKYLYQINQFMNKKIEIIHEILNEINNKIILILENNLIIKEDNIYEKIINKSINILDLYIDKFNQIYIPKIHDSFIKKDLFSLININFLNLIFLTVLLIFFTPLVGFSFLIKCIKIKYSFIILFYNCLFAVLFLSLINCIKIIDMKMKITYINDFSKVAYFLFKKENLEFLINQNNLNINEIIDINFDNYENNILYYFNKIINYNGKISELFYLSLSNIKNEDIIDLDHKLMGIISEESSLFNEKIINKNLNNYIKEITTLLTENLTLLTYFQDLTGTGYQEQGVECPMSYLTYINFITSKYRKSKYINCSEYWSIGYSPYKEYIYQSKNKVLDCNGCVNHYFQEGKIPLPLLNYVEYSFEEIQERYKDLQKKNPELYNIIIYEFTSLENFRKNDILKNQLIKMKNYTEYLNDLQDKIFNSLKECIKISKNITDFFNEVIGKYSKDKTNIYSFLDCDFLRQDINFILSKIDSSFILRIENFYSKHIIVNNINILFSFILIIFYSCFAYEIPFPKEKSKNRISLNSNKIRNEIKRISYIIDKKDDADISFDELKHFSFIGTNFGPNISIIKGGTTINNNFTALDNNYNDVTKGKEDNIAGCDLLTVNKTIKYDLGLNQYFGNEFKSNQLETVEEVKEEIEDNNDSKNIKRLCSKAENKNKELIIKNRK